MMIDIDMLLAVGAAYKKVSAEQVIFSEGSSCNFYYQLVSGSVRWSNVDDEGNEFIQNMVVPGESFGEIPLFDEGPYVSSAIAVSDSVLIRLHKSEFHRLIADNPSIHFAFSKLIASRLRFKFMFMKELAAHDPERSVNTLLQYLKRTNKYVCQDCNKVMLTRQQIANMTGLRVETVIRTIRNLHDRGILTVDKGKVYC